MTYRKIRLGGQEYGYAVGRSYVHIKGGRLAKPLNFRKDVVGEKYEWRCECCGEPLSRVGYSAEETGHNFAVTPGVVRKLIEGHLRTAA
jgi:hypothetical protein